MNDKKVYRIFEDELEEYYKKLIYKRRSSHKFDVEEENSTDSFENERYQSDYINNRNKLNVHIKYLIKEINKKFYYKYLAGRYEYDDVSFKNMLYISQPFKNGDFDVFISHSHKDIKIINQLSDDILKKFHKSSFIDSKYWKYKDNLIDENTRQLCNIKDYINKSVNTLNAFVQDIINIYLIEALQQQMFSSQIIIQVYTNNYRDESPWIYFENRAINQFCSINNCNPIEISIDDFLNLKSL